MPIWLQYVWGAMITLWIPWGCWLTFQVLENRKELAKIQVFCAVRTQTYNKLESSIANIEKQQTATHNVVVKLDTILDQGSHTGVRRAVKG